MNFIKELLADALNGLSLSQIPFVLFRLFVAGALAYVLGLCFKKWDETEGLRLWLPVIGVLSAFLAIIAAYALPLAVLCIPVLLFLMPLKELNTLSQKLLLTMSVGFGLACGAGNTFLAILAAVIIIPIILIKKP